MTDEITQAFIEKVVKQLYDQCEGRNHECWPVASYGGKDADLEPWGCTGIEKIEISKAGDLLVTVGGHKVIDRKMEEGVNPSRDEALNDLVCACGFTVEGDHEEYFISFSDQFSIDGRGMSLTKVCFLIDEKAREMCGDFEQSMVDLERDYTDLYNQLTRRKR